jgi:hypothetical protein
MALPHPSALEDQEMTRFDIESADLAHFDRRMLADVGLIEGEGPHPIQLRKRAATSGVAALIALLLGHVVVGSARLAR